MDSTRPWDGELMISAAEPVAEGVLSLRLERWDGGPLPAWEPGAHLCLLLDSGLVREYSLCGDPRDRHTYRIAVLDDPAGRGGSREVHRTAVRGGRIGVRGPRNNFALVPAPEYLFLAGGIGITPILPMIREAQRRGADWKLLYGGRSRNSMAFAGELCAEAGDRVTVVAQDEQGLPDLAGFLAAAGPDTAIYCCGPEGLLQATETACREQGCAAALHVERFARPAEANPATDGSTGSTDTAFDVRLERGGETVRVPPETSILEAVRAVRPEVAFSCQQGYCGSCEVRVLDGVPEHRDVVLSEEERAEGDCMMICVGRARTPSLTLDL